MKQSCNIEIAVPRRWVVALFDDPANILTWQPDSYGLNRFPGRPVIRMRNRDAPIVPAWASSN